jgi:hypothetical protein
VSQDAHHTQAELPSSGRGWVLRRSELPKPGGPLQNLYPLLPCPQDVFPARYRPPFKGHLVVADGYAPRSPLSILEPPLPPLSNRAGRIEGPSPPQRVGFGEQELALSLGLVENPSTVTSSPFTRRRACQRPDGRRRTVPVPGRRCARGCYLSLAWPGGRRCRGIGTDGHAEIGHTMAGKVTQRFQRTLETVTCQP